jgi:hypothetical protein
MRYRVARYAMMSVIRTFLEAAVAFTVMASVQARDRLLVRSTQMPIRLRARAAGSDVEHSICTHFHDIYIDGKKNAKMTGDLMKMLMLTLVTLPFMVRALIAPEVRYSLYMLISKGIYSVTLIYMYILIYTSLSS